MKVYQIDTIGASPAFRNVRTPQPERSEIGVCIKAAALNFADLLMAKGEYQDTPSAPFTLGLEASGLVETVGPDVTSLQPGDRVAVFSGQGALAEYGVFGAERAIRIPENMSFEHAAAFQIAYGTSHLALVHRARLREGENLVVLGASGGVGLTAVEIGARLGANVIAVARGPEKLEVARAAGAHEVLDSGAANIRETILALGGADVVYDAVGGDQFRDVFRSTNPGGRILVIGFASGTVPDVKLNHVLVKNIDLIGIYWGGYLKFAPDAIRDSLTELLKWYEDGGIKPHISHTLPLDQVAEGMELLRSRRSTGKVVIVP